MSNHEEPKPEIVEGGFAGFLKSLLASVLRDLAKLILAFVVGTGAGPVDRQSVFLVRLQLMRWYVGAIFRE